MRCLLTLLKNIFSIEQSIHRDENGVSQELWDLLTASLIHNRYTYMEGTAGETSQMLLVALIACGDVTEFCECLRDVIESPLIMECEAAIHIIS
jgi:hypothetical protein